tara:strand:+ start:6520 stop:7908 length:1389 start_codon:yes stop_codon:yes gene_type:complete
LNSITIVIGLGRSGIAAAKLLHLEKKKVVIIEKNKTEDLKKIGNDLSESGITVKLGRSLELSSFKEWLNQIDCVVISPSIPWNHETLNKLRDLGITVKGEISLAWERLKNIPWIAITGTNGKTTVTKMLTHVLIKNQTNVLMGGNVGIPASEIAIKLKENNCELPSWIIIELSSYQIEEAPEIKPQIGIWTTLTPDHLERHVTLDKYIQIKKSLIEKSNIRIYNSDDQFLNKSRNELSEGIWVSTKEIKNSLHPVQYWINKKGMIIENKKELFHSSAINIPGKHNLQNLLMVVAASRKVGLLPENIESGLNGFEGVPHRLEHLGSIKNIQIYNDSKATNYDSAFIGIKAIQHPSIIIAGGEEKEGDPAKWLQQINETCSGILLFGSSANSLKKLIQGSGLEKELSIHKDLRQATEAAISMAIKLKASSILLSPACASFDQYKDFEERGNHFKSLIKEFSKRF